MTRRFSAKNEQGQTMAEFALVLPVILLLLFAVIQFGITFNHYLTVTDAARAGARKAAVSRQDPNRSSIVEKTVRAAAADLDQGQLKVTVASAWQHGTDVTVTVTYPYDISLIGVVMKSGQLSSAMTERVE